MTAIAANSMTEILLIVIDNFPSLLCSAWDDGC
jgi:hypothetical protein